MAACMSKAKCRNVGRYFAQRLGNGWETKLSEISLYNPYWVTAERKGLKVALDIGWVPSLRVYTKGTSGADIIELPNLEAEKLGKLAANIAWATANAREELL